MKNKREVLKDGENELQNVGSKNASRACSKHSLIFRWGCRFVLSKRTKSKLGSYHFSCYEELFICERILVLSLQPSGEVQVLIHMNCNSSYKYTYPAPPGSTTWRYRAINTQDMIFLGQFMTNILSEVFEKNALKRLRMNSVL